MGRSRAVALAVRLSCEWPNCTRIARLWNVLGTVLERALPTMPSDELESKPCDVLSLAEFGEASLWSS